MKTKKLVFFKAYSLVKLSLLVNGVVPTSSPGRFSLAFPAPPPKPGKSALGTRLGVVRLDE